MKVIKTVSPFPHQFIRFVKHHPHTFKMTYNARINTPSVATGAVLTSEMFDAKIMNTYGWSDIASMYDIDVPKVGSCRVPNQDIYQYAQGRADLFFSLMQEHIEMLFSLENPPLSF